MPDFTAAFPPLSDAQIDRLREAGHEEAVSKGDLLFREGDASYDFFVVVEGAVNVFEDVDCERPIVPDPVGPGNFLGEVGLLSGERVYATARVEKDGRVIRVPAEAFRALVGSDTDLASVILTAFRERREIVSEGASGLTIVGSQTDPDAVRLAEFARRNYLPVRWLDLEGHRDEALAALREHGLDPNDTDETVVTWGSKTVLHAPTNLEVARAVGVGAEPDADDVADVLIVGAGPAGLAAAVYGASEGLKTVVLDEIGPGGQASWSSRIENYLGFPTGISGTNLTMRATVQARKFGARLVTPHRAVRLGREGDGAQRVYVVTLADGPEVRARTLVLATGAHYRRPKVPHLSRFEGAGVYYAATEMEARTCGDATVVVVGGGNSAGQAAMFLSERAARVLLLLRGDDLGKSMSRYLADRVEASPHVEVRTHSEVRALYGSGADGHEALRAVDVENTAEGTTERVETPALFLFIGADPCTAWLAEGRDGALSLALDDRGFVCTGGDIPDEALDRALWPAPARPMSFETSLPGVFAVGDVRSGSTKRVAGAVGEGAVTVKAVHDRLAADRRATDKADERVEADVAAPGETGA